MPNDTVKKKFLLKDHLFNTQKITHLAKEICTVYPVFKKENFIHDVVEQFPRLELKARISWITQCLHKYLPEAYQDAVAILLQALPKPTDPTLSDNDFGDFIYAPYAEFVAKYGCTKENLYFSLEALKHITTRFSVEDAIRYFINCFPVETMRALQLWSHDPHYHVRRLCSEGTRPKLPWAQKITLPLDAPLTILDTLFFDSTRFVTRSVANHMNDISKIDPDVVIKKLNQWKLAKKQHPEEMAYIIRHSLRTLIKQGNPKAMSLLGIPVKNSIALSNFTIPSTVILHTNLVFSFELTAKEETSVIADFLLYFCNKTETRWSKKVYKLAKGTLYKDKPLILSKKHLLKKDMTTRTINPGKHRIEIQINGTILAQKFFEVKES